MGIHDGDRVRVTSRRGSITAPARITEIAPGTVFEPFHYGYWDEGAAESTGARSDRAANELTLTEWDPVSKQPVFKNAAVPIERLEGTP